MSYHALASALCVSRATISNWVHRRDDALVKLGLVETIDAGRRKHVNSGQPAEQLSRRLRLKPPDSSGLMKRLAIRCIRQTMAVLSRASTGRPPPVILGGRVRGWLQW